MGSAVIMVGVWDDICQIPAKVKLVGQILAAVMLVACGVRVDWVLNPVRRLYLGAFISVPLTILWVVGFTNMVNLIDGLDGLAAGVSSIAAVSVALIAYQLGQWNSVAITVAMAGAAIGFLQYNFNPAKIFMGDTGSMFSGMAIAAVSIRRDETVATVALVVPVIARWAWIMDTALAIAAQAFGRAGFFALDRGICITVCSIAAYRKNRWFYTYAITAFLGMIALLVVHLNVVFGAVVVGVVTAADFGGARHGMIAGGKCASEKH